MPNSVKSNNIVKNPLTYTKENNYAGQKEEEEQCREDVWGHPLGG
jgi:hypothetical protein